MRIVGHVPDGVSWPALGFADLGGGGDDSSDPAVITGYKKPRGKKLPPAKKQVNQLIAAERAACEHAFAHLKNWRAPARHLGRREHLDDTVQAVAGLLSQQQNADRILAWQT
ncbi:transposase family protein [Streptomyces hirsutus]|uniref:transposase family protein n=1 Tax=Streptomyces hirsutus TaxID=35620 RepID=UPI0036A03C59